MGTLWAVNIHGPDDLIPVASYVDAMRVANAFNAWWQAYKTAHPLHDYDPRMWAVPVEYSGGAESHAHWLANPSPDYVGFIDGPAHDTSTGEG